MKRPLPRVAGPFLATLLCSMGCAPEPLSEEAVTTIGPGDAMGRDEPSFPAELLIVQCDGICGPIEISEDEVLSSCDVGVREAVQIDVTLEGGRATLDVRGSERMSRLEGGAFADGALDVGGIRTVRGGLTSFDRFRARITGDIDAPATWSIRTAIDVVVNADPCVATYALELR